MPLVAPDRRAGGDEGLARRPRRSRPRRARCAELRLRRPGGALAGRHGRSDDGGPGGLGRPWSRVGPGRSARCDEVEPARRRTSRGRRPLERRTAPSAGPRTAEPDSELSTGLGWPAERSYPQADAEFIHRPRRRDIRRPRRQRQPVVSRETPGRVVPACGPPATCAVAGPGVRRRHARRWRGPPSTAAGSDGARMRPPLPRPERDPGHRGRQPEGRGRQDHVHGERRRRAGPARPAGAGASTSTRRATPRPRSASSTAAACPRPTTPSSTARRWPR